LAKVEMSQFSTTKLADFYEMLSCDWPTAFVFIDNLISGK